MGTVTLPDIWLSDDTLGTLLRLAALRERNMAAMGEVCIERVRLQLDATGLL